MRPVLLLLIFAFLASLSAARAQSTWVDRTTAAGIGGILNDVAWGKGLFVAVGTNSAFGLIHSSPDGVAWTNHTQAANIGGILNGIAFGDGQFVAVGTNTVLGLIASSPNGTTWTNHTSSANIGGILRDVAFGNGVWVAVGETGGPGVIATSTNGTTWVNRTTSANVAGILHAVTFADGKFVTVGTNGSLVVFATSTNGTDWTVHTTTAAKGGVAYDVVHDGTQFIATGDGTPSGGSTVAHVLTSPDGITWTSHTIAAGLGGIGFGLGSGGGTTVMAGRTGGPGLIATSTNGTTWTNLTVPAHAPGDLLGVARGTSRWVAVGTNQVNGVVMTSDTPGGGATPVFFDDVVEVCATGGSFTAGVSAGSGVAWTVTENAAWLSLSGASGTGNGSATVNVQFNNSVQARTANLTVGTDTLRVNQAGAPLDAPVLDGFYMEDTNVVSLSWNQIFVATGYRLERRISPDGAFAVIAQPASASATSVNDSNVSGGVRYDYRVRAVAGQLNSDWSNIVTVGAPPDIPGNLVATARNASQIQLTWSDVSGEQGYLIYRETEDGSFFEQVARVPANEVRYIDSGLEPARSYRYQIEAESEVFGRNSPPASATTTAEVRSIGWSKAENASARGYFGVATGNGTAVIVGAEGRVTTSTDLTVWTEKTPPGVKSLRAIAFAQNKFVTVGDSGVIFGSPNGAAWTPATSPTNEDLVGIAFSQNLWVAVGAGGALLTSPDGTTWTKRTSPAANGFANVFAGGSKFVAIEDTGRFLTSNDGMTWHQTRAGAPPDDTPPFFWTRTAGAFGGNAYSAVGPNGYHSFGPAAETWSEQNDNRNHYFEAVAYGAGKFVAVGLNGSNGSSTTGQGYLNGTTQVTTLRCIAYGFSKFVAAGDRGLIVTSTNGTAWTTAQQPEGTEANLTTVVAGDSQLVVFGEGDSAGVTMRNRFDGTGWIVQPFTVTGIGFAPNINDALYAAGQYVAVGAEGVVVTSPDGQTWTTRRTRQPGLFNDNFYGIAFGQNRLIVGGGHDPLMQSSDAGVTWTAIPGLPNQFTAWNLTYGPRWVSHFGGSGTLRMNYSDDGLAWKPGVVVGSGGNVSELGLGSLDGEPLHVGAGAQFGGGSPQAMVSWDGRNWNAIEAAGIDYYVTGIAYGSGVFVAVGQGGAHVWASLDGAHWEPAPAGFLPGVVGEFRDVAYFQGHFYAVGPAGLILRLDISSSAGPPIVAPADVEIVNNGGTFQLRWPSSVGLKYQVQGRANPATGAWIPAGTPLSGTGGIMQYNATPPAGEKSWFWVIVTSLE
jgi:hypothetical protein